MVAVLPTLTAALDASSKASASEHPLGSKGTKSLQEAVSSHSYKVQKEVGKVNVRWGKILGNCFLHGWNSSDLYN